MMSVENQAITFREILRQVESSLGDADAEPLAEAEYNQRATYFAGLLNEKVGRLIDKANQVFSAPAFGYSIKEVRVYPEVTPLICTAQIRPSDSQSKLGLLVWLQRRQAESGAHLRLSVDFFDLAAQQAFESLYTSRWTGIEGLVRKSKLQFDADPSTASLQAYKGKSVTRQIDLYLSEGVIPDGSFNLGVDFRKNATEDEIEKTFMLLTAIYDSTYLCIKQRSSLKDIRTFIPPWL